MATPTPTDLFRVPNLVAVITGGGSGLGKMMALSLASAGASKIYIIGRRYKKLQETALGYSNIIPVQGDATSKESLKAVADRVRSEFGYLNTLIVNSGAVGPTISSLPQDETVVTQHYGSKFLNHSPKGTMDSQQVVDVSTMVEWCYFCSREW